MNRAYPRQRWRQLGGLSLASGPKPSIRLGMSTLPTTGRTTNMLAADRVLEEVTRTIVEHLRPRRVVLFGSRARGDAREDSDYDIMVEMETELGSTERRGAVLALFPRGPWSVDFLVYTPDEVERWRNDVGFVVYDIVREGRVLYCRPDLRNDDFGFGASSPTSRVREGPGATPESLQSWIGRAQDDFATMEAAARLERPVHAIVCFHAHQCAEKLLKACLIARSIRLARTHDLRDLLTMCIGAGFDLERLRTCCETLYKLWPKGRYPEAGEPTGADTHATIEAAAEARSAILPLIQRAAS